MSEANASNLELPNIITSIAKLSPHSTFSKNIVIWENVIFSLIVISVLSLVAYFASRKNKLIPDRFQNAVEVVVGGLDDFICGILGDKGRKFTPFIGTLFLYIIVMNLSGLIPFIKSSTSSWSTTLALAICVFVYVQYSAFKELGFFGYLDHMMGKPRGILAFSVFIPLMMFVLEIVSQLVRPISLSLRLRSNIWGDDMLLAVLANFGIMGVPLLVFSSFLAILASVVQAVVFCLLTTIYFALCLPHEEEHA
ncbi:MAG: F0F1 ATP synthase subunit A [Candidatus Omnitrophica bacterium]|nr:F0F1 ATP synthase subunit A [Candidatus Omnitrophota bacterium]